MADDLLSRVQILLDANTARFEAGMQRAEMISDKSVKKMNSGFQTVTSEVKKTQSQVNSLTNTIADHENQVGLMSKSYSVLAGSIKAAMAGISISAVATLADEYTQYAARIRNATSGTEEFTYVQNHLLQTANTTYRALSEAQDVYLSFAGTMKSLGYSTKETLELSDSLSFAFTANAARADQAQSASDALSKSMQTGKVDADSWISIITAADNVIGDMAKTTGKTETEIRQLGANGSISLNELIETLIQTRDQNENLANSMSNSLADGFTKLKNETAAYIGQMNDAHGITNTLASSLGYLGENIDTVAIAGGVMAAVMVGRVAQGYVTSIAASFEKKAALQQEQAAEVQLMAVQVQRARLNVAQALTEVNLARTEYNAATTTTARVAANQRLITANMSLAISEKQATVATDTYTASQVAATGATSALSRARSVLFSLTGGWVGLAVTVAGVAASYALLKDSTTDTSGILDEQGQTVEKLTEKYEKLGAVQKDAVLHELKQKLEDQRVTYVAAASDLSAYAGWLESSGSVSEDVARKIQKLYKEYSQGRISSDEFYTSVKSLNGVSESQIEKIRNLVTKHQQSKTAYDKSREAQAALTKQTDAAINANDRETTSIEAKRQAQLRYLTSLQQKYAPKNMELDFVVKNTDFFGGNKKALEKAKDVTEFYKDNGIPFTRRLTIEEYAIFEKQYNQKLKLKKLEDDIDTSTKAAADAERKKTEQLKKQSEELAKQQQSLKVNSIVQANATKYNFSSIEQQYGILPGLLSGIHMQESEGDAKAVGPMTKYGTAKGGFQFLDSTASRFGLRGNDVFDIGKAADAAGQYLKYLYEKFGSWDKAISAYHAGEGNVQAGTGIGPINRKYVANVKGYVAGYNHFSGTSKDFDQQIQDQTKFVLDQFKEQQKIHEKYYNDFEKLEYEHNENVADIKNTFAHDTTTRDMLLTLEDERNEKLIEQWLTSQDQRVKAEVDANKKIIEDRQRMYAAIQNPLSEMQKISLNATAQTTLDPQQLQQWKMNNQHQDGYSELGDSLSESQLAINSNEFLSTQERYDQLELVYQQYLDSKKALGEQYAKEEQDLAQSQYVAQLDMWAGLVSQGQSTWSMMTQSVKDANGEQSAAYKTMFLMQQAFAISSAIISTEQSAAKALEMGPILGIPASTMVRALGYANVAMIAAQTIAGFSDGGYTGHGGKYDMAGIVHRGEIVWSQDDISRWGGIANVESMRKSKGYFDGGVVAGNTQHSFKAKPNFALQDYLAKNEFKTSGDITINNNAPVDVNAQRNSDGSTTLTIEDVENFLLDSISNPNSRYSKATQQNYTASRRRY